MSSSTVQSRTTRVEKGAVKRTGDGGLLLRRQREWKGTGWKERVRRAAVPSQFQRISLPVAVASLGNLSPEHARRGRYSSENNTSNTPRDGLIDWRIPPSYWVGRVFAPGITERLNDDIAGGQPLQSVDSLESRHESWRCLDHAMDELNRPCRIQRPG